MAQLGISRSGHKIQSPQPTRLPTMPCCLSLENTFSTYTHSLIIFTISWFNNFPFESLAIPDSQSSSYILITPFYFEIIVNSHATARNNAELPWVPCAQCPQHAVPSYKLQYSIRTKVLTLMSQDGEHFHSRQWPGRCHMVATAPSPLHPDPLLNPWQQRTFSTCTICHVKNVM